MTEVTPQPTKVVIICCRPELKDFVGIIICQTTCPVIIVIIFVNTIILITVILVIVITVIVITVIVINVIIIIVIIVNMLRFDEKCWAVEETKCRTVYDTGAIL